MVDCTVTTTHYSSVCALLKHYDANDNGIISESEKDQAISDYGVGIINNVEVTKVYNAYSAGSINAYCDRKCYKDWQIFHNGSSIDVKLLSCMPYTSISDRVNYADIQILDTDGSFWQTFTQFDEIIIKRKGTILFNGVIGNKFFKEDKASTFLECQDHSILLGRQYIIEDFTAEIRSDIVEYLVETYSTGITTTNVTTTTDTITRLFKGMTPWQVIKQLAIEEGFIVYIDKDADLHFVDSSVGASGLTLIVGTDPIVQHKMPEPGTDIINKVTVHGDSCLAVEEDPDSQLHYGFVGEELIVDKSIKTEAEGTALASGIIDEKAWALRKGQFTVKSTGYYDLRPGTTVAVTIPRLGITADDYIVMEVKHQYPEGITHIKLMDYDVTIEQIISKVLDRLQRREVSDIDISATQVKKIYETLDVSDAGAWELYAINDSFILGLSTLGSGNKLGNQSTLSSSGSW